MIDPDGETPVGTDFDGRFTLSGKQWRLAVMRGMPPHDGTPEGVLIRHFFTLQLAAGVSKYVASTFNEGGIPAGVLQVSTPNATQDDINAIRDSWAKAHGKGKRSTAVLNATISYQPISVKPVDAEADKLWALSDVQVAQAFNLDPIWLGQGAAGMNYNNNSDRRRDLLDITENAWASGLMQTLSALLPYGSELRVNWATFTAPNLTEQADSSDQTASGGVDDGG